MLFLKVSSGSILRAESVRKLWDSLVLSLLNWNDELDTVISKY